MLPERIGHEGCPCCGAGLHGRLLCGGALFFFCGFGALRFQDGFQVFATTVTVSTTVLRVCEHCRQMISIPCSLHSFKPTSFNLNFCIFPLPVMGNSLTKKMYLGIL